MPSYKRGAAKVSGFALSSLLSGAANVLTIPLVVSAVGPTCWGAIATGQAVGAIGSVIIQLGWGVTGPTQVAKAETPSEQLAIYRESLYFRSLVLGPALLVVAILTWLVVPREFGSAAVVAAIGAAMFGLTAAWYLVGIGHPSKLLLLDTIPRSLVVVVGGIAVTIIPNENVFAGAIVLSALIPFFISTVFIYRNSGTSTIGELSRRSIRSIYDDQWPGVATSLISSSYKYIPLVCVSAFVPAAVPAYALVDRVLKFAVSGVRPVSQALQGWVPRGSAVNLGSRVLFAAKAAFVVGVAAGLGFVLFGPLLSSLIGANEVLVSWSLIIFASCALAFGTTAQTTGLACLTACGEARFVAISAAIGAVCCLAVIWPAIWLLGAAGAMLSVALAELCVLVVQVFAMRSVLSRMSLAGA